MKITQVELHGEFEGRSFMARVIEPSPPRGVWPGNPRQIRVWAIVNKRTCTYDPVDDATAARMEAELGQLQPHQYEFDEHPSLGRVVVKRGIAADLAKVVLPPQ